MDSIGVKISNKSINNYKIFQDNDENWLNETNDLKDFINCKFDAISSLINRRYSDLLVKLQEIYYSSYTCLPSSTRQKFAEHIITVFYDVPVKDVDDFKNFNVFLKRNKAEFFAKCNNLKIEGSDKKTLYNILINILGNYVGKMYSVTGNGKDKKGLKSTEFYTYLNEYMKMNFENWNDKQMAQMTADWLKNAGMRFKYNLIKSTKNSDRYDKMNLSYHNYYDENVFKRE